MIRNRLILPTFVCALVLAAIGCDALVDRPELARDFGSPYNVLFGEVVEAANGLTQATPFTDGSGALHVAVQFTGGCANHTFRADHTLAEASATVWLVHASNGETCEALLSVEVVVPLPSDVLEKDDIILVGPSGQDEIATRFDNPSEDP